MTALTRSRRVADGQTGLPAAPRPRRRNGPLTVTGVLVVAGCALMFAVGWLHAGHRQPVLALARVVAAGQVFSAADLQVVRVSAAGPVRLVPASQESTVIGRTAAAAMPAGSLLTSAEIGGVPLGAGQAILGVAVKPGQYPPDLSAGQTVNVLATPGSPAGTSGPTGAAGASLAALPVGRAVVLSVSQQASTSGVTVVEVEVSQDAVPQLAAASASGQIALATIPAGSG